MSATRRLLPYALLLVAPAVALAAIGWRSVGAEDRARREDARRRAETEARRLVEEEADALEAIRMREERRPYFQYQPKFMPEDAVGLSGAAFVDTPLLSAPDDPRISGWFQWTLSLGVVAGPDVFVADPKPEAFRKIVALNFGTQFLPALSAAPSDAGVASAPVQSFTAQSVAANEEAQQLLEEVQVANATQKSTNYLDNYRERVQQREGAGPKDEAPSIERVPVRATRFRYCLAPPSGGGYVAAPVLAAWRLVWIPGAAAKTQRGAPRDRWLLQGYLLSTLRFFPGVAERAPQDIRVRHAGWSDSPPDVRGDRPLAVASLLDRLDRGEHGRAVPKDLAARMTAWPDLFLLAMPDLRTLDDERRASEIRYLSILCGLVAVVGVGLFVLLRSVRREVALAERKQDFVAAVTHELKTPLAGIRMYADMLKEGWVPDGESVSDYAGRIAGETQRLSALVDQILDLAALERGVATVRPMPGDLGEAVRSAVALTEPAAAAAGVPVRVEVEDGLPLVPFDATLVRPLVVNLLDNAIKYSEKAETKDVRAIVRRAAAGGVEVAIVDRGPGIAKADQARLFEPFSRGGREETRTARGVGLGLALVRRYADAHKAKVTLDSEPGRGTTVVVRFPLG